MPSILYFISHLKPAPPHMLSITVCFRLLLLCPTQCIFYDTNFTQKKKVPQHNTHPIRWRIFVTFCTVSLINSISTDNNGNCRPALGLVDNVALAIRYHLELSSDQHIWSPGGRLSVSPITCSSPIILPLMCDRLRRPIKLPQFHIKSPLTERTTQ